jgi:hypothetical protein
MTAYPGVLLVEAIMTVAVAPMIGLAIRSFRVQAALLVGFTAFLAAMHSPAAGLTLGAGAFALAGLGAWCRAVCADRLDAIGVGVIAALSVGFGVFAAGALTADLSTLFLNALLIANPIVATASAAGVDIFRGALLYELSPIAHREFQYPAWQSSASIYACVAVATFLIAARAQRMRAVAVEPRQLTQRG